MFFRKGDDCEHIEHFIIKVGFVFKGIAQLVAIFDPTLMACIRQCTAPSLPPKACLAKVRSKVSIGLGLHIIVELWLYVIVLED